eukprot:CAMPEP_0202061010 /NCGR_PEP_ID=MMETSP0963-20130614/39852_1 /ASSEMBLY_ACC=CAM_ASM_000494 /TAXON_ID=4773 /ORGANISM="Schizochytrium aggregatum, Strain ATCC28209" /LENGTH=38 /DNA_ID= /DNA_START= /DNA_END= /DNA_ORIENTATION=
MTRALMDAIKRIEGGERRITLVGNQIHADGAGAIAEAL